MTTPSSSAASKSVNSKGLIRALLVFAASSCILLVLWVLGSSQVDPYVKATTKLEGSIEKGDHLFRMNCAGCHGVEANGLLAPDLHSVSSRHSQAEIINQIVRGRTPPMPSFQMEPQAMADLIAYLNSLDKR